MDELFSKARALLTAWRGDRFVFGRGVLPRLGDLAKKAAAQSGKRALLAANSRYAKPVEDALAGSGVELCAVIRGSSPNTPQADVYRIESCILQHRPDFLIAAGGGSTIDAVKAALALAALGAEESPEVTHYFGTGIVSAALAKYGKKMLPLLAVETSSSSGSHLTKYANVTDPAAAQKKLIVDEAVVPPFALFDYDLSASMPARVTVDGAFDALSHCFEMFTGLGSGAPEEKFALAREITLTAIELVVKYAPAVVKNPADLEGREALGLASDLGGYAIMIGGTHGPHMTSFSLVDLCGHGTACGIMNPYYAVFFAPKIEKQLRLAGEVFKKYGFISADLASLGGRELGLAFAEGMRAFAASIGAPGTLAELEGFTAGYVEKIVEAAKDPQLEMKLKNMPEPLTSAMIDGYLAPVIRAAVNGDFSLIRNL